MTATADERRSAGAEAGEAEDTNAGSAPPQSRWYFVAMLALVAASVALLEYYFSAFPVPPGVDPGHWLSVSYAYVGLPYPPAGAVGSPYVDPPLVFPVLGGLVIAFDSPETAGLVYAGILLALFGLTTIHLARTYLKAGVMQVALVGLAVFNGTTLFMLFWGGYPNFAGFMFLNEAAVFLLLFVQTRRWQEALCAYGFAALVFLTHDLTFSILAGLLVAAATLLLIHRRISWRFLLSRANLFGVGLLAATIVAYDATIHFLHIVPPGYLSANPGAYVLDPIGDIFNAITPNCPTCLGDSLPSWVALVILFVVPGGVIVASVVYRKLRWPIQATGLPEASDSLPGPRPKDPLFFTDGMLIALAWVTAAAFVPALGYVVGVDTDYDRFAYFLPLPVFLLVVVILDRLLQPVLLAPASTRAVLPGSASPASPTAPSETSTAISPTADAPIARWRTRPGNTAVHVAVVLTLVIAVFVSAMPVEAQSESEFGGPTHDAEFIQAMQWLSSNPTPGAVLTPPSTARWVQALTARASYDVGPTWVLFYPFQITNAEEVYWALNSQYTVSNNLVSLLYSGNNTSTLLSQPTYAAFDEGVQFPLIRLQPASTYVNVTTANGTRNYPAGAWGSPSVSVAPGPSPSGVVTYGGPYFSLSEVGQLGAGGVAWVNFTVAPEPGSSVNSLSFGLTVPIATDSEVHAPNLLSITANGSTFLWSSYFRLGALPGNQTLMTTGTLSETPSSVSLSPTKSPNRLGLVFPNPNPKEPLMVSLKLSTPGTSNPAVTLPTQFSTGSFLVQRDVKFLLLPNSGGSQLTAQYYEAQFSFQPAFNNTEWAIYST